MNILVTGGNGFAGKYITKALAKKGHTITATYRHSMPDSLLQGGKGVHYIRQELSQPIELEGSFDAIVHTACSRSGAVLSMEEYVRDNVDSARRIVEFATEKKIDTIVYFSTRSIYGTIFRLEVTEETDCINAGKYGMTKYIAEMIFQEADHINTLGLRTPGIIGPGAHDVWLVKMVEEIANGRDVSVSDFCTKNLVWLEDIAAFIEQMLFWSKEGKKYPYPVVNLACKQAISNLEMVQTIKERCHSKSNISVHEPDAGLFILNADKAFEMGFEPSAPMEIVNGYLDYYLKE